MNIDKITKECPRAWEECIRFFIHPHNYGSSDFKYIWSQDSIEIWEADGVYLDLEIHFRELYDYFDSVGIIILIGYDDIRDWKVRVNSWSKYQASRTKAECLGFEKGFEFREKQLRQHTDGINSNTVS